PRRQHAWLDIRGAANLAAGAGVGKGAEVGVADRARVAPEDTRAEGLGARLPGLALLGELGLAQLDVDRARFGVDSDHVAVLEQPDRPTDRRLGPYVPD